MKPGFAYSADRLFERLKQRALDSQFIAIAKAPCQAFAAVLKKFFSGKTRASLFGQRAFRFGNFARLRRELLARAARNASESPPMKKSCRRRPAGIGGTSGVGLRGSGWRSSASSST